MERIGVTGLCAGLQPDDRLVGPPCLVQQANCLSECNVITGLCTALQTR
jgi:hypothetical protein